MIFRNMALLKECRMVTLDLEISVSLIWVNFSNPLHWRGNFLSRQWRVKHSVQLIGPLCSLQICNKIRRAAFGPEHHPWTEHPNLHQVKYSTTLNLKPTLWSMVCSHRQGPKNIGFYRTAQRLDKDEHFRTVLYTFYRHLCWSQCRRVPIRTGKPGKMGRHFAVREKSGNSDQTGKVRENHTKYWKTEGISDKCYLLFFSDI